MCGIAGFCDFTQHSDRDTIKRMTNVLIHRGPDDVGYEILNTATATVGLGNRRLSILDLSKKGHQPMHFDNLSIVHNGEVYNFKEISEELEKYGYVFESQSDTEVILKAFHKWGTKCLDRFIGMFSFIIFNNENKELSLFRDRAGVKPLYYYWKDDIFLFASELKSFHEHPGFKKEFNNDSLALYLQYGYIPAPHCIFKNTYKLLPGNYAVLKLQEKKIKTFEYWDVINYYNQPLLDITEKEAITETEKILKSAFRYRMVSDVPVGVFLSGGYDSTAVTALLQSDMTAKLKTFTIGFYEDKYNEALYAEKVANYLGTDHTEYYCTQNDALQIIPKLPEIYDEPFGDSSAIPTTLISKLARQSVKVALSADAGDEIFAGYWKYQFILNYNNIIKKVPKKLHYILKNIIRLFNPQKLPIIRNQYNISSRVKKIINIMNENSVTEKMRYLSKVYLEDELKIYFKKQFIDIHTLFNDSHKIKESISDLNKMLAIDYKTYMVDDILVKVDRATMYASLEGRDPLLDHRIIEFVAMLPAGFKNKNGISKWLIKKIVHKYIPKDMMERPKKGFSVPIYEWFRDELKTYFLSYLSEKSIEGKGIFNTSHIIKLRDSYLNGKKENVSKLWLLLMFEMWHEKWM